jgi:hypothetical protein
MASGSETLVKDWQALLEQAKEMQLAIDKFASTLLIFVSFSSCFRRSSGFPRTSI